MRRRLRFLGIVFPILIAAVAFMAIGVNTFAAGEDAGDDVQAEVAMCNGLAATIVGTAANDFLVGTPGDDVIQGFSGGDTIIGYGGNDTICGQGGPRHHPGWPWE